MSARGPHAMQLVCVTLLVLVCFLIWPRFEQVRFASPVYMSSERLPAAALQQSQPIAAASSRFQSQPQKETASNMLDAELQRRLQESEILWSDSVTRREAFYASEGGIQNVVLLGIPGTYTIWDVLIPAYSCPWIQERMGRLGDGGKWVCGAETLANRGKKGVIYSIGVERESSFEAEMLDRYPEATVYGYDLSVDSWGPQIQNNRKYSGRAFFHKYGISAVDEPKKTPPNFSLKTMMAKNGHDFIDIFKIDVEGSEWDVLGAIVEDFKDTELPFGQMLIEIHVPDKSVEFVDKWFRMLEDAGLRAYAQELNTATVSVTGLYYSEYCFINVKSSKSPLLGF